MWLLSLLACQSEPVEIAQPVAKRVEVTQLRVRAMPPAAPNTAAFLTLHNSGPDASLISASASISSSVELHTHAEVDGVMQMRQLPEIPLPANQDVVLKPGGLHIMFIGLTEPLAEGAEVPLTLSFSDGSSVLLQAPVRAVEVAHP